MTAKSFEEWIDEQPLSLQKNLSQRDEAMKRDAFEAGMRASRAALLSPDVAGLVERLRCFEHPNEEGEAVMQDAAAALESLAAQVAERDAEIARLKMENSKLRSALEIVHFKREPWQ